MRHVVISEIKPRLISKLRRLPLFHNAKFVRPGRLLTSAEFHTRQKAHCGFSSEEIFESYNSEIGQMQTVADRFAQMERNRTSRLRKIRNHSGAMSRRKAVQS